MSDLHTRVLDEVDAYQALAIPSVCDALAALRAVVELHKPERRFEHTPDWLVCPGCDIDGYDAEYPPWPCSTIQAIADQLGLTEGATDVR